LVFQKIPFPTENTRNIKAPRTNNTMAKEKTNKKNESTNLVATRGRTFEGTVVKKFSHRVVVEFERTVYVKKYERFFKKKTRLHARLPQEMDINVGDYIKIRETRPLSKIIHFLVIEKVRSAAQNPEAIAMQAKHAQMKADEIIGAKSPSAKSEKQENKK